LQTVIDFSLIPVKAFQILTVPSRDAVAYLSFFLNYSPSVLSSGCKIIMDVIISAWQSFTFVGAGSGWLDFTYSKCSLFIELKV